MPTRLPPTEGQQKETQYLRWHKDTSRKGLWSEEDDKIPLERFRDVWGNIKMAGGWRDQCFIAIDNFDAG